jgi:hypothetical protein
VIPSDHFVRFYNEVFNALAERGWEHLRAYWRQLGRVQAAELAGQFRTGGLPAAYDYWSRIFEEENCQGKLTLTDDYFEFRMDRCPSLSKILDSDAPPCPFYCDHCMGWIQPVMDAAGLHPVLDIQSRAEPHCVFRVYTDPAKAEAFRQQAALPAEPYADG